MTHGLRSRPTCQPCVGDPELVLPGKSRLLWTLQIRPGLISLSLHAGHLPWAHTRFLPPGSSFLCSFQFSKHLLASPRSLAWEISGEEDCQLARPVTQGASQGMDVKGPGVGGSVLLSGPGPCRAPSHRFSSPSSALHPSPHLWR